MAFGNSQDRHWVATLVVVVCVGLCMEVEFANADGAERHLVKRITPSDSQRVRRSYHHISRKLQSDYAILLEGSPAQIHRLSGWLDEISQTQIGKDTLDAISNSGNVVTIRHSAWALMASGRTHAPISSRLTDGRGEDVLILFDARIPDSGSHRVFDRRRQPIAFSAVHNLFHELSHARHLTNGSWRYFDSEGQAIEEENRFRQEFAEQNGESVPALRFGKRGEQLWWPLVPEQAAQASAGGRGTTAAMANQAKSR